MGTPLGEDASSDRPRWRWRNLAAVPIALVLIASWIVPGLREQRSGKRAQAREEAIRALELLGAEFRLARPPGDAGPVRMKKPGADLAPCDRISGVDLIGPGITDDAFEHVAAIEDLVTVSVALAEVTGSGFVYLARLPYLGMLDVEGCPISDDSLRHIRRLEGLRTLSLQGSPVTDAGLRHLHGHRSLETLMLLRTKVSPTGVGALRRALPQARIVSDTDSPQKQVEDMLKMTEDVFGIEPTPRR